MGIAEREQPWDNPAFTNMAAKLVLRKAALIGHRLDRPTESGGVRWRKAWSCRNGIARSSRMMATEGRGEKGATPDPLMGLFPLGLEFAPEQERATLDLYLGKADDYIGSPMLSALYGVWAARSGDRKLAAKLLKRAMRHS